MGYGRPVMLLLEIRPLPLQVFDLLLGVIAFVEVLGGYLATVDVALRPPQILPGLADGFFIGTPLIVPILMTQFPAHLSSPVAEQPLLMDVIAYLQPL